MANVDYKDNLPGFTAERSLTLRFIGSFSNRWTKVSYPTEQRVRMQAFGFPIREGVECKCLGDYQWCIRY